MARTWIRNRGVADISANPADIDLVSIPVGTTLLRIHAALRVVMTITGFNDHAEIEATHLVAGIYTTLTVGGAILNPATQSADQAPPLQRWLWWEQLSPVWMPVTGKTQPDTRQEAHFLPALGYIDIEAQVSASTAVDVHMAFWRSHTPHGIKVNDAWWFISALHS